MDIQFILPVVSLDKVVGGYRVHYEYANRLALLGHHVSIVHMFSAQDEVGYSKVGGSSPQELKEQIAWFSFAPAVRVYEIIEETKLAPCDVRILTAWQTGEKFGDSKDGATLTAQIAYDYEFWMLADVQTQGRMRKAFQKADVMVATSGAVAGMLKDCKRSINATIYCGYESNVFKVLTPIENRMPTIGILLRDHENKRIVDAIAALDNIRKRYPIHVLAAGSWHGGLPEWIEPILTSSDEALNRFFNETGIFILPSEFEGWGLPAIEAMAAGCCVISARNGGVEDFLYDRENGLLYEPKNIEQLESCIALLLGDDSLRTRLARKSHDIVQQFRWDASVHQLEDLLLHQLKNMKVQKA